MQKLQKINFGEIRPSLLWIIIIIFSISVILGFLNPEIHYGGIPVTEKQITRQNEKVINRALQNYFADHGHYPKKIDDLTTSGYPYFEEIPINPESGLADWLVTSRSEFKTKNYFTQEEFHLFDKKNEGIYKVKANKTNYGKFKQLMAEKSEIESGKFNKIFLIFFINLIAHTILYFRKQRYDRNGRN